MKISVGVSVFLMVMTVYCISLIVWIVTLKTGEGSVNDLADRLRSEVASSTQKRISDTLDAAETITRTNARLFKSGAFTHPDRLDPRGPEVDHFLAAFRAQMYGGLFVTTVSMTDHYGNLFGVYNDATFQFAGMWEQFSNATHSNMLLDYETYPMNHPLEGQKKALIGTTPGYNTSEDIWYTVVNFTDPNGNAWTPMYVMSNDGQVISMISQSHAAFRPDGSIIGVMTIDLVTGFVSEILSALTAGQMFSFAVDVIPTNGVFLGSSTKDGISKCTDVSITDISNCPVADQDFLSPMETTNSRVHAITTGVLTRYGSWGAVPKALFKQDGDLIAIEVVNKNLLSWRILIAVPESSFLADTRKNTVIMIVVQVVCGLIIIGLCVLFSVRIRNPLMRLVNQIGFLQRFETDKIEQDDSESLFYEIARLQQGHMSLKSSMTKVKSFVPQSLLSELQRGDDSDDDDEDDYRVAGEETDGGSSTHQSRRQSHDGRSMRSARSINSSRSRSSASSVSSVAPAVQMSTSIASKAVSVLSLNFTGFHQSSSSPSELPATVKKMVDLVVATAKQHRGVLDYFQGDHFVLSWNAVIACGTHIRQSLVTALTVVEQARKELPHLGVSAGLSTGAAMVGNVGNDEVKRFAIVGSCFTQAVMLERLCKLYKDVHVLATKKMILETAIVVQSELLDVVRLKGERVVIGHPRSLQLGNGASEEWMYELKDDNAGDAHNKEFLQFLQTPSGQGEATALPEMEQMSAVEILSTLKGHHIDGPTYVNPMSDRLM